MLERVLQRAGELAGARGDFGRAADAFEESLNLSRTRLDSYGNSPQTLRDLTISLNNVADVRRERGDPDAAAALDTVAAALRRRLADRDADGPA